MFSCLFYKDKAKLKKEKLKGKKKKKTVDEVNNISSHTMQFFLQLAMQFYSWEI